MERLEERLAMAATVSGSELTVTGELTADYEREMEAIIPEIVKAVQKRQLLAAESRTRIL